MIRYLKMLIKLDDKEQISNGQTKLSKVIFNYKNVWWYEHCSMHALLK